MTRKHPAQELEEDVLVRTSNMGQGRSDYEAFHTLSPAIHLREIHTHDFFELYIHLNGFPRLYVDNKIVTLQRGSLMIFPPFWKGSGAMTAVTPTSPWRAIPSPSTPGRPGTSWTPRSGSS